MPIRQVPSSDLLNPHAPDYHKIVADHTRLRILIVGSGGREHAIAQKLEQSEKVDQIFVAPGNGGTGDGRKVVNVKIAATDFDGLSTFATASNVNLVVVGPEQPLVDGLELVFRKACIPFFGPTPGASLLEGSKAFAKNFMHRHGIPTAEFKVSTSKDEALRYLEEKRVWRPRGGRDSTAGSGPSSTATTPLVSPTSEAPPPLSTSPPGGYHLPGSAGQGHTRQSSLAGSQPSRSGRSHQSLSSSFVDDGTPKIVLKASQLCGGKGVYLPCNPAQADQYLDKLFALPAPTTFISDTMPQYYSPGLPGPADPDWHTSGTYANIISKGANKPISAGTKFQPSVVIEKFLGGNEFSVLAFCDGYAFKILGVAQDHKKIGEGDVGEMTGGMGAYSVRAGTKTGDVLGWTVKVEERVRREVLEPTLRGMRMDGKAFVGLLFVGLMLLPNGDPYVLEYNTRFGDPEAQTLIPLLTDDTDLAEVIMACVDRRLDCVSIRLKEEHSLSVVCASGGYPGSYEKGKEMKIPKIAELPTGISIYHAGTTSVAGTTSPNDIFLTDGGRVLTVVGTGPTLEDAAKKAYQGVKLCSFEGMNYRKDIGHRALNPKGGFPPSDGLTYESSGVSFTAAEQLIKAIKPLTRKTARLGADANIGAFGGAFDIKKVGYEDPILVAGADGVGTKLEIAKIMGKHNTIGIDLVAMNVNDLLAQGAEPLFFLDYYACGRLDPSIATEVVKGIAEGCESARCALIGGETAEMPGMYQQGVYDLAGFSVGAVERDQILPRPDIKAGDVLLGLSSSGLHSNGFSLVRKILARRGLDLKTPYIPYRPDVVRRSLTVDDETIGQLILTPTRIYVDQVLTVLRKHPGLIKGMSHITGGGFYENIPRMLPEGSDLAFSLDVTRWRLPDVFRWLAWHGLPIEPTEMAKTWNCGIGFVLIVDKERADEAIKALRRNWDEDAATVHQIGEVIEGVEGEENVILENLDNWRPPQPRS